MRSILECGGKRYPARHRFLQTKGLHEKRCRVQPCRSCHSTPNYFDNTCTGERCHHRHRPAYSTEPVLTTGAKCQFCDTFQDSPYVSTVFFSRFFRYCSHSTNRNEQRRISECQNHGDCHDDCRYVNPQVCYARPVLRAPDEDRSDK